MSIQWFPFHIGMPGLSQKIVASLIVSTRKVSFTLRMLNNSTSRTSFNTTKYVGKYFLSRYILTVSNIIIILLKLLYLPVLNLKDFYSSPVNY